MNEQLLDAKLRRLRATDKLTGERATFALGTDPALAASPALNHVRKDPWPAAPVDLAPADPETVARIRAVTRRSEREELPAVVAELRERMSDGSVAILVDAADLRLILDGVML